MDITRHLAKPPDALTCLSLHLAIDGNCQPKLLLSTREHSVPDKPEAEPSSNDVVVLDMAVLKEQESLWHCLTISLVRWTISPIGRRSLGAKGVILGGL